MAYYFYTKLVECETYEDFKETLSFGGCRSIGGYPRDNSYSLDNYSDIFKGFNSEEFYSADMDSNHFLYEIIYGSLKSFLDPKFNVKTKTVTFYENLEKREKGIRSNPTKMGKFFRKVAPYFSDKQIEFAVNYTVDFLTDNDYEYNVAKGNEITEIYLSKVERGRNIGEYSCINASCMRHNDWQIHPTKVYATESWELHYLTNEDGYIGARVLVCREDDTYSYIYASCEHAGNTLEQKLKELGFVSCDEASRAFDGAKLLKIEGNGGLVAPYIDYHCEVKDCGLHLEITHGYSDYCFNSTSGCVDHTIYHECEDCGRECCEEDMIPVNHGLYCEDCVFYCEHFDEHAVGESFEVFYSNRGYYTVCKDALEDMGAVYNEEENEWQTAEWFAECTEDEEDDEEGTEIENEPKKEIKVGDKCIVINGYNSFHHFPVGTVVYIESANQGVFDCKHESEPFNQYIKEQDLVVAE